MCGTQSKNIQTRALTLVYNAISQQSTTIFILFDVNEIKVKQVTVYNSNTSTPANMVGYIKSDLMSGQNNQPLCTVSLATNTSYFCDLDVSFKPVNSNVNNTFNFYLMYTDALSVSTVNLNATIMLLLEFHSN